MSGPTERTSLIAEQHIPYRQYRTQGDAELESTLVVEYTPSQHNALSSSVGTSVEDTVSLLRWCCVGFWFCLCTLGLSWIPYFWVKRGQEKNVQNYQLSHKPDKSISMYKPPIIPKSPSSSIIEV
ncbi:MAG: hypothetical protein Q8P67_20100 [archaeon]|nr:hypothetical protein [archaeon]